MSATDSRGADAGAVAPSPTGATSRFSAAGPLAGLIAVIVAAWGAVPGAALGGGRGAVAPPPLPRSALLDLPVKEISVFKDGHAFVLHEGTLPTNEAGEVVVDSLPTPVIGTFWSYSATPGTRLTAVVAGQRTVASDRPASDLADLLRANPGAAVLVRETSGAEYEATVLELPQPASRPASISPPSSASGAAQAPIRIEPQNVLLRLWNGTRLVPLTQISSVTFRNAPELRVATEEQRRLLTLRFDWGEAAPPDVAVGMVYLQKGIRWIPSYRVDIDGAGTARVELQATLINEMLDLADVKANLVIGVPSFRFQDTLDPMALQESLVRLSQYFDAPQQQRLSNLIQTQTLRVGEYGLARDAVDGGAAPDDDVADASRHEDLFLFSVPVKALRKGERMVVPVASFELRYEDVFVLDLPFGPPSEVRQQLSSAQHDELARLLSAPRVVHRIRFTNDGPFPLTTAPALITQGGRLLAQSMMTYTPVKGRADLDVTTAVDVPARKSDQETKRELNAARWGDQELSRVSLDGVVTLTNLRDRAARIEVTRYVLGNVDAAGRDGIIDRSNALEDPGAFGAGFRQGWWGWYNWPQWWQRFNGVGRIRWALELAPGERAELDYSWHYFW